MLIKVSILMALFAVITTTGLGQRTSGRAKPAKLLPIIDMHIHADTMEDFGGGNLSICLGEGKLVLPAVDPQSNFKMQDLVECDKTIRSSSSDTALKSETYS